MLVYDVHIFYFFSIYWSDTSLHHFVTLVRLRACADSFPHSTESHDPVQNIVNCIIVIT